MKRWIWIPILLIIVFLGDRGFGHLLRKVTENSQFRYSRLYTDRAQADLLLLGNSRGLTLFQPTFEEKTGRSTFNMSYNGMPPSVAAALLEDYLDLYPAPRDLILDITLLDRENEPLVRDFRVYAQFSERLSNLLQRTDTSIYNGTKFSHLTRYGGEVGQRMLFYSKKSDTNWLLDRVIPQQMLQDTASLEEFVFTDRQKYYEYLRPVLERYKVAGTNVHLVMGPYLPAFRRKAPTLANLKRNAEREFGQPVHDYTMLVEDAEMFGDYQHLNVAGSSAYIDRLIQDLNL